MFGKRNCFNYYLSNVLGINIIYIYVIGMYIICIMSDGLIVYKRNLLNYNNI